jgi:hypothetical protein
MWGPTIIGYGEYHYTYDSGREGDFLATGFSPRKSNLSLYIMPSYQDFGHILDRPGKHKLGKACLYINKLADVDMNVVEEIVSAGLTDLKTRWPVTASWRSYASNSRFDLRPTPSTLGHSLSGQRFQGRAVRAIRYKMWTFGAPYEKGSATNLDGTSP